MEGAEASAYEVTSGLEREQRGARGKRGAPSGVGKRKNKKFHTMVNNHRRGIQNSERLARAGLSSLGALKGLQWGRSGSLPVLTHIYSSGWE